MPSWVTCLTLSNSSCCVHLRRQQQTLLSTAVMAPPPEAEHTKSAGWFILYVIRFIMRLFAGSVYQAPHMVIRVFFFSVCMSHGSSTRPAGSVRSDSNLFKCLICAAFLRVTKILPFQSPVISDRTAAVRSTTLGSCPERLKSAAAVHFVRCWSESEAVLLAGCARSRCVFQLK